MKIVRFTKKVKLLLILTILASTLYCQTNTIKILTDLGTKYDYSYSIELQNDGKVVQAGDAWGTPCLIRFDTTGNLDNTFGNGGKIIATWDSGRNPSDNDIKIQQDGKIVLGTSYYNGEDEDFIIARYIHDGSLDDSFGTNGKVITQIGSYNDRCNTIAIQSDGKILAAGGMNNSPASNYEYDFVLVRYNTNGTLDSTFGEDGVVVTNIGLKSNLANSMVVQPDGKIILAGEASDSIFSDFATVRYNTNGTLDSNFGNNGIVRTELSSRYDFAKSIVLQLDGKIIAAGSSQSGLSQYNFAMIRYNTDGTIDNTFGTNGIVSSDFGSDFGNDIALQADGKIIMVGSSATGTIYDIATLRFDSFGIIDKSFGNDGMIRTSLGNGDSEGHSVCLKDDGEIIIAGIYNHGSPDYFDFALVRLFSVLMPSVSPVLSSPPDETTDIQYNPTFIWNSVSDATSYNLEVSTSQDFSTAVFLETDIITTGYSVEELNANTTYFWRVNAVIEGEIGPWSDIWSFTTSDVSNIYTSNFEYIELFPVPVQDILFINGKGLNIVTISVLSMDGILIKQIEGIGIKEIDFSDLQSGIYVVRFIYEKTTYIKFVTKI